MRILAGSWPIHLVWRIHLGTVRLSIRSKLGPFADDRTDRIQELQSPPVGSVAARPVHTECRSERKWKKHGTESVGVRSISARFYTCDVGHRGRRREGGGLTALWRSESRMQDDGRLVSAAEQRS